MRPPRRSSPPPAAEADQLPGEAPAGVNDGAPVADSGEVPGVAHGEVAVAARGEAPVAARGEMPLVADREVPAAPPALAANTEPSASATVSQLEASDDPPVTGAREPAANWQPAPAATSELASPLLPAYAPLPRATLVHPSTPRGDTPPSVTVMSDTEIASAPATPRGGPPAEPTLGQVPAPSPLESPSDAAPRGADHPPADRGDSAPSRAEPEPVSPIHAPLPSAATVAAVTPPIAQDLTFAPVPHQPRPAAAQEAIQPSRVEQTDARLRVDGARPSSSVNLAPDPPAYQPPRGVAPATPPANVEPEPVARGDAERGRAAPHPPSAARHPAQRGPFPPVQAPSATDPLMTERGATEASSARTFVLHNATPATVQPDVPASVGRTPAPTEPIQTEVGTDPASAPPRETPRARASQNAAPAVNARGAEIVHRAVPPADVPEPRHASVEPDRHAPARAPRAQDHPTHVTEATAARPGQDPSVAPATTPETTGASTPTRARLPDALSAAPAPTAPSTATLRAGSGPAESPRAASVAEQAAAARLEARAAVDARETDAPQREAGPTPRQARADDTPAEADTPDWQGSARERGALQQGEPRLPLPADLTFVEVRTPIAPTVAQPKQGAVVPTSAPDERTQVENRPSHDEPADDSRLTPAPAAELLPVEPPPRPSSEPLADESRLTPAPGAELSHVEVASWPAPEPPRMIRE